MFAVPGNAPPDEAVCIAARAAVGVAGAGVSLIALTPTLQNGFLVANTFHLRCLRSWLERQRTCTTRRQSVMDIPAQAPDQPAIVNPVAAVNPIATNGNDNMPQPVGAVHPHQYPQALPAAMYPGYLDQFQHLGAPSVQMEFPGGHGMAQEPIYPTPLGPAPSSMLMPQNLMISMTPLESLTDVGTLCNRGHFA
ncbi:hypothetical protein BASA83_012339 [Batrachochytrium salamandrivorans]|nr:hypothetical protein BASA83_012339 [Batrachochytrium salamandrivorans]